MKESSRTNPRELVLLKTSNSSVTYQIYIASYDLILCPYHGPRGQYTGHLGDCIRKLRRLTERHPELYKCTGLDALMEKYTTALLAGESL